MSFDKRIQSYNHTRSRYGTFLFPLKVLCYFVVSLFSPISLTSENPDHFSLAFQEFHINGIIQSFVSASHTSPKPLENIYGVDVSICTPVCC